MGNLPASHAVSAGGMLCRQFRCGAAIGLCYSVRLLDVCSLSARGGGHVSTQHGLEESLPSSRQGDSGRMSGRTLTA